MFFPAFHSALLSDVLEFSITWLCPTHGHNLLVKKKSLLTFCLNKILEFKKSSIFSSTMYSTDLQDFLMYLLQGDCSCPQRGTSI